MSDIERRLQDLREVLEIPDPPPIAPRVAASLRDSQAGSRSRRWPLLIPVAAAVVATVSVPPARSTFERWLHIGGVGITRIEALPEVQPRGPIAPGTPTTLQQAQASVRFDLLVPKGDGSPDHVFLAADPPGGQVTLVYGRLSRPRLLINEFTGEGIGEAILKTVGPDTAVEATEVKGEHAIWLGGHTHLFRFVDADGVTRQFDTRLAGNTLVWEHGRLTIRLEGSLTKRKALKLARSFASLK
jgi:hypothetical protein